MAACGSGHGHPGTSSGSPKRGTLPRLGGLVGEGALAGVLGTSQILQFKVIAA